MADSAFLRRVRAECGALPASAPVSGGGSAAGAARGGGARSHGRSWPAKPSGARPKRVDSSTLGDAVSHTANFVAEPAVHRATRPQVPFNVDVPVPLMIVLPQACVHHLQPA